MMGDSWWRYLLGLSLKSLLQKLTVLGWVFREEMRGEPMSV